ncbi:MAG: glycosyltransferase family 4 protein [Clostridioides sp.]|nr:glycosyltransferase family 4 protein [Clostridioides sp.]
MKILHILTQKPDKTGSGIYLRGIVNGLELLGHKQAVIAGIDKDDPIDYFDDCIDFYPVFFNRYPLNFNVVGMSDSMPYESTRYRDLTEDMVQAIENEFANKINSVISNFKPDIILCNHLYLLTSFVRSIVNNIPVIAICHGTCLRQLKTIDLKKDFILKNISKLDLIFALHNEQKKEISNLFSIDPKKIITIGSGFNDSIFYDKSYKLTKDKIKICYAGKISNAKGVASLINSLQYLVYPSDFLEFELAGIGSDKKEYNEILNIAEKSKYKINFLGQVKQEHLAELFNRSHIFILPSFYEGLPIVLLESLACSNEIIVSDICGIKDWIGDEINSTGKIEYVKLPKMIGQDVPEKSELPLFEKRLARALTSKIEKIKNQNEKSKVDMTKRTWNALAEKINTNLSQNNIK